MATQTFSIGTIHTTIPSDFRRVLEKSVKIRTAWESLTPLARNEWLCWMESAALNETKARRIKRAENDLAAGKRRPCCWIGCIHRTDKEVSPSVKWVLSRNKKKS